MLQASQPPEATPVIPPGAIHPMPVAPSRPFPWKRVGTLAEVAGLLILLIVFVVIIIRGLAPVRPSPDREGQSWTHRELADHLETRGLKVGLAPLNLGLHPEEEPSVLLMAKGSDLGSVVILKRTTQAAAESAGAMSDLGFSWGRFLFLPTKVGSPSLVPQIKKALE